MTEAGFVTNPDIFFVQSSLLAPDFAGNGKWALYDPATRQSYHAAQQDELSTPPVFRILAHASDGPVSVNDIEASHPWIGRVSIENLIRRRFLLPSEAASRQEESQPADAGGFYRKYHLATVDYPFVDYSDPRWLENDIARMSRLAHDETPPPVITPRLGDLTAASPLPSDVVIDGSKLQLFEEDTLLTTIFRFAFGKMGLLEGFPIGPWIRKTSPSGGGRHPTEGVLLTRRQLGRLEPGVYVYDVANERFRVDADPRTGDWCHCRDGDTSLTIMLRTRVERPMFRYRDIRAWRPVMIDLGHVVETLRILADRFGYSAQVHPAGIGATRDALWLDEPPILCIHLERRSEDPDSSHRVKGSDEAMSGQGPWWVNPFTVGSFADGHIFLESLFGVRGRAAMSECNFATISWCLPSRRQDRPTDRTGIGDAVGRGTDDAICLLTGSGLLWDKQVAIKYYKSLGSWARRGWYLTALAMAESRSDAICAPKEPLAPRHAHKPPEASTWQLKALLARKTVRTFDSDAVLSEEQYTFLLNALCPETQPAEERLGVYLAIQQVAGIEPGIYKIITRTNVELIGDLPSAKELRQTIIGQEPAASGSLVAWLIADLRHVRSGSGYERSIQLLGQVGQRVAIATTHMGMGLFVTPAVNDGLTSELLGVSSRDIVTYALTVGIERGRRS